MKYGCRYFVQADNYILDITLPTLWDSEEDISNIKWHINTIQNQLYFITPKISGRVENSEWWRYRVGALKNTSHQKDWIGIIDYIPINITLSSFIYLLSSKVQLITLDYQIYIN